MPTITKTKTIPAALVVADASPATVAKKPVFNAVATVAKAIDKVAGTLAKGEKDAAGALAAQSEAQKAMEKARADFAAGKDAFAKADVRKLQGIVAALHGVNAVSEEEYRQLWADRMGAKLSEGGFVGASLDTTKSHVKAIIRALTAGCRPEAGESYRQFRATAAAFLRAQDPERKTENKGRPKGAANATKAGEKGVGKGADTSPVERMMEFAGTRARAQVAVIILREHAAAFDQWAAGVLAHKA